MKKEYYQSRIFFGYVCRVLNIKTNHFVSISFLSTVILLASLSNQEQSVLAAEGLLPRISFEKTVCDLGDVGQGTKNSCEFRFTNTGRGLLKIGKISRTCGCTR